MSDAMTNREIEDVLTSIRRLVAQDGTRVVERPVEVAVAAPPRPAEKLILTEAQRIDAQDDAALAPVTAPAAFDATAMPSPDFGRLEATIAELEAAVSASGEAWESEAVDEPPRASNVTDLYGRLHFGPRRDLETAPPAEPTVHKSGPTPEPALPELAKLAAAPADPADLPIAAPVATEPPAPLQDDSDAVFQLPAAQPVAETPETDAASDGGEAILDEAALYALVAQIVREELHGQLGERITAQVRKLVRAEIAKALDDRKFL